MPLDALASHDVRFTGGLKGSFEGTGTRPPPPEGALQRSAAPVVSGKEG